MAQVSLTNAKVIDTTLLKQVFETMEYPIMWESTNLAESWLREKREIAAYLKDSISEGTPITIDDINYENEPTLTIYEKSRSEVKKGLKKDPLITVYSPKVEDVEKLIIESTENNEWSSIHQREKAFLIERLAKEIDKRSDLICQLEILTRGIVKNDTKAKALPLLVEYLQYYAGWSIKYSKEKADSKPKKITAGIISDNSFLAVFGFILAPALAAGYNIILQTEPRISIIAALIIELAESVGIPKGVIKLLPGRVDLNLIFQHKDINVISRFGNLNTSNFDIEQPLGTNFLSVINSKSSMIVFNSADLDSACNCGINACWGYQGMLPWSVNTVLVQEDVFETFVNKLKHRLSSIKMSLAVNQLSDVSYPKILNSKNQSIQQRLEILVNTAKADGIEVFQAKNNDSTNTEPFYPTLLIGQKLFSSSRVVTEDDNLPVLTVVAFRNTNEGISLMNNTRFGFGASVWTENISLANEVIGKLNVANIWLNNHGHFTAATSFTPYKQSGTGYFGGEEGFREYTTINTFSTVNKDISEKPQTVKANLDGIIATAKKGHEEWNKMTCLMRSQFLRKTFDDINSKIELSCKIFDTPNQFLEDWTTAIYEGSVQINNNLGSVSVQKPYELRTFKEAVGVVVIEDDSFQFLDVIVGALLLGNSIIILNFNSKYSKFLEEIGKRLLACNVPKGVFSTILNCGEDIFNDLKAYTELSTYFTAFHKSLNKFKFKDHKRIYSKGEDWLKILTATTKTKNIWSNIGDSVL
ncbi:hypothetical protein ILUMI_00715 [Ignelater luminosus]|uniref:Aldehyde dehydrogenase domain-containing protein n=1 Tax=Ignelater luminosus TaxID=2038154 RepID=A0A8K0GMD1_IGNLU|nr:hypothetical protein ILUMI_00715 [Ignelater luminosus]